MNRLPNEIIVGISSYLTILNKLNLASACKNLHKTILENTLYNTLVFNDNKNLDKAIELIDKKGSWSASAQSLSWNEGTQPTTHFNTFNSIPTSSASAKQRW